MSFTRSPISRITNPLPWTMTYGLIIDGRVDERLLYESLSTLVTTKWPILGSRFGKSDKGELEYHIPSHFDPSTPPFTFSYTVHSTPLSTHFNAPPPTKDPFTTQTIRGDIFKPPAALECRSPQDYMDHDQPLLHLQVCHFHDAKTAIGLSASHTFCDTGGAKEILSALSLVMNGRAAEVPELIGDGFFLETLATGSSPSGTPARSLWLHEDPVAPVSREGEEPMEPRWVFLPTGELERLKGEAGAWISSRYEADEATAPKVSTGDVLTAWWVKTVFESADPKDDSTEVAIGIVMSIRRHFGEAFDAKAYLHNALHVATALVPSIHELSKLSIAELAVLIRKAIQDASPEDILEGIRLTKQVADKPSEQRGNTAKWYPPEAAPFCLSNWLTFGFGESWFSPPQKGGTGKIEWVHEDAFVDPAVRIMDLGVVTWRDEAGVWLFFCLRKSWWERGALGSFASV